MEPADAKGCHVVFAGGRVDDWAEIAADRIVSVGARNPAYPADATEYPGSPTDPACADAKWLDARGCALSPARINAHTHIYSGLAPLGMPAPEPTPENFVQILERVWWRLDRALDAAILRASARLYVAEALLAGTATLIDHHESPRFIEGSLDVLADACDELGARALICFGATERNDGRDEAKRGLAECRRFISANTRPTVCGAVALHASFTVSDETVREAGDLCRELGVPMHVHLAEDAADVADAKERGYAGPLERLADLGALPAGSILAHGVHLSADQVRRASDLGCWIVQNPRSNRGNDVGYPRHLGASTRVALGTDGYPARMDDELDSLRTEAAANGEDVDAAAARAEGAYALASELFNAIFAPLAAGNMADVAARGRNDGRLVHLVVGGRPVVQFGKLVDGDIDAIRAEAQDAAAQLWARMAELA